MIQVAGIRGFGHWGDGIKFLYGLLRVIVKCLAYRYLIKLTLLD